MSGVVVFDLDNTLANTETVREIRDRGAYAELNSQSLSAVRAYKPVLSLLRNLKSEGVLLAVVTNSGRTYANIILNHLGLDQFFDVVVTYTDVGVDGMKPSPKGIRLALEKLGVQPSSEILYVGDEANDFIAAYHAGVTPVLPTWASRQSVSMAPAVALSSDMLADYPNNQEEFRLFGERCAELQTAQFERLEARFLPLNRAGEVVTLKDELSVLCLGRYFSQKAAVTAWLHENHSLSRDIAQKEEEERFVIPNYWVEMIVAVIGPMAEFMFGQNCVFDIVTVIPAKQEKNPRLELLLSAVANKFRASGIDFCKNLFYFDSGARSQKTLSRAQRAVEVNNKLHLNGDINIAGKRVLVIDDVITTGATMMRAMELLEGGEAKKVIGLAIAKTVSVEQKEKICPNCSRPMRIRKNSESKEHFWGCSGYNEEQNPCTYTEGIVHKQCPECGNSLRLRTNARDGSRFWGCSAYFHTPSCTYTAVADPAEIYV